MSGYAIIGALLQADEHMTEFVPAPRLKAGRLPDGVGLPALLVRTVSIIERQKLKRVGHMRETARVAVTVRAASYEDQVEAMRRVRACCAGRTGDIGGGKNVSVLTAGTGPDVAGPGNSFEQTQDFSVSYDAPV